MQRRSFIKGLVRTAAGLLVAEDALAIVTQQFWPGADFEPKILVAASSQSEAVVFVHKVYGLGFRVTQQLIEDDLMYKGALSRVSPQGLFDATEWRWLPQSPYKTDPESWFVKEAAPVV